MKHASIAIRGATLINRISDDTDTPWWELLELPIEVSDDDSDEEDKLADQIKDAWFKVTWPEHVISPRYNGDATYSRCKDKAEAVRECDEVHR